MESPPALSEPQSRSPKTQEGQAPSQPMRQFPSPQAERRPQDGSARRQDRDGVSRVLTRNEDPGRTLRKGGYHDRPISAIDDIEQVIGPDVPEPGTSQTDALKLRLDLNLAVDISIKARVHGDVTLSLLG